MSDNTEARIRLAEFVGWRWSPTETIQDQGDGYRSLRKTYHWAHPDHERKRTSPELPDPFTDANDDYAVLCYYAGMEDCDERERFLEILWEKRASEYELGDYARAALRVLDND